MSELSPIDQMLKTDIDLEVVALRSCFRTAALHAHPAFYDLTLEEFLAMPLEEAGDRLRRYWRGKAKGGSDAEL